MIKVKAFVVSYIQDEGSNSIVEHLEVVQQKHWFELKLVIVFHIYDGISNHSILWNMYGLLIYSEVNSMKSQTGQCY